MRIISVYPDNNGKSVSKYIGTWITNLNITNTNIVSIIQGARSRWKIENECFNTLKNQGYCMQHNYGQYEGNLSFHLLPDNSIILLCTSDFTDNRQAS
jgi:hypothetical protein